MNDDEQKKYRDVYENALRQAQESAPFRQWMTDQIAAFEKSGNAPIPPSGLKLTPVEEHFLLMLTAAWFMLHEQRKTIDKLYIEKVQLSDCAAKLGYDLTLTNERLARLEDKMREVLPDLN